MSITVETSALDQLLDPLEEILTPELAQKLVGMHASPAAQARLDALAERNSAGSLTAEEHAEYMALLHAGAVMSLMQAKAKRMLRGGDPV